MSLIYFETNRLIVRQWVPEDAPDLHEIMSDRRVHTYTGDTPWTLDRTKRYIQLMLNKDFRTLELFHGACITKDNKQLIGFSGLNPYLPKQPELEWQLGVPFWGKGYATEVGKAAVRGAFNTTDITCIYGMANPENKGSIKALEKVGMTCIGLQEFRGHMDMFFRIDRDFYA